MPSASFTKKFNIFDRFIGYHTKPDKTNINGRALTAGSQNVLINDAEMVETRKGYSLYGAANTATNPIISSYEFNDSSGNVRPLRSITTTLQVYIGTVEGTAFNSWETLEDGLTSAVKMQFDQVWSSTESIDILLFVMQDANLYEWSGGVTTLDSVTAATLVKNGSGTWAASRFLTAGTRQVRIKDTGGTWRTFTYTGGESTTTLTGVTPDPTAFTFADGALVLQEVRSNSNTPASGLTTDVIKVLNNQVYIADTSRRTVYVSKNTAYTDYTFSTPRTQGEGALLTLDGEIVGMVPLKEFMAIAAGKESWFKTKFSLIDVSGLKEILEIKKLDTGSLQGAYSQDTMGNIGGAIVYLSNEPALRMMTIDDTNDKPRNEELSNQVKPDFDNETWTNAMIRVHKTRIYLSSPVNGKLYINEARKALNKDGEEVLVRFWQPPQILPVRRIAIISGVLYGHSNSVSETYELFDGTNDNALPMNAKAVFPYLSYGDRFSLKSFDKYGTEGYISSNTSLLETVRFDYKGHTAISEKVILGSDSDILFGDQDDDSLGNNSLGDSSLGGDAVDVTEDDLPKFRHINELSLVDFYEYQVEYSSNAIDQQWKILAHGSNLTLSPTQPAEIGA